MKDFLKLIFNFIFSFRGFFEKSDTTDDLKTEPDYDVKVTLPVEISDDTPPTQSNPIPPTPSHTQRYCWCLDNGHGSLQPGKRSPKLNDGRQLLEWEFNRSIVSRIIPRLEQLGIAYYNVVPEDDVGSFLKERVNRANEYRTSLRKIFVSIHANAGPAGHTKWSVANGVETWYKHDDHIGEAIANIFQYQLIKYTGLRNRNIKTREEEQFYVLTNTNMPAILTENGFFNNQFEVEQLLNEEFRQKVANAHVEAILKIEISGLPGYI